MGSDGALQGESCNSCTEDANGEILIIFCVFFLGCIIVISDLWWYNCLFSAERDHPASPADGINPHPRLLPQVCQNSWRRDESGGEKAVLGVPGLPGHKNVHPVKHSS